MKTKTTKPILRGLNNIFKDILNDDSSRKERIEYAKEKGCCLFVNHKCLFCNKSFEELKKIDKPKIRIPVAKGYENDSSMIVNAFICDKLRGTKEYEKRNAES